MNRSMDMLENAAIEPDEDGEGEDTPELNDIPPALFSPFDRLEFVTKPAPQGTKIQCQISREDPASGIYNLYVEDTSGGQRVRRFLMSSKKISSKSAHYSMSLDHHSKPQTKQSNIGKLRSNFLGTCFTAYDLSHGQTDIESAPSSPLPSASNINSNSSSSKKKNGNLNSPLNSSGNLNQDNTSPEIVSVIYDPNILGIKGPRKMTVVIPGMTSEGERMAFLPKDNSETILERFKNRDHSGHLVPLINKPPHWNEALQSFTLDFRGRVLLASVKNFQLVHEEDVDYIVMQMGKVYSNLFSLDFQYPLSAQQAFAIALSSFHSKLACE